MKKFFTVWAALSVLMFTTTVFAQDSLIEKYVAVNSTSRSTITMDPYFTNHQIFIKPGTITRGNVTISYDYGTGILWNATKTSVTNATVFSKTTTSLNQVSVWPSGNWNIKTSAGTVTLYVRSWKQ